MFRILSLVNAWADFYSNPSSPASIFQKEKYTKSSKTAAAGSQYVFCCFFLECTATKGGGILSTSQTNLLIEETSFSSCQATSGNGGGLFLSATATSNCIIYRVCSYACTATSNGPFCHTTLPKALNCNNMMNDSSVVYSNCPSSYRMICINYGKIIVSSINSSKNTGKCYVGILLYPSSSCNYSDCQIMYSYFSNNEAKDHNCVVFDSGGKAQMKSCNIINNTQSDKSRLGILFTNSPLNIYDSCALGNNADYSFYGNGGSINLYNTIFDKSINSYVTIKSAAPSSFINELLFIKTGECDAEKAKIYKKSRSNLCTYKRRIPQNVDMFKLSWMILICK